MAGNLKLARLYFVLLAIVALGRWLQGVFDHPYEKGHHVFSIVILTHFSALYYGAFLRRWRGFSLPQAVVFAITIALVAQIVIFLLTAASYALGMQTYFNNPRALNSTEALPLLGALQNRLLGLVGNTLFTGISGALGWLFGGLLPNETT